MPDDDDLYDETNDEEAEKTLIAEFLNIPKLEEIRKIFEANNFRIKATDFKLKVLSKFQINLPEEEIENAIIKISLNKDGFITWSELISYLCLELDSKRQDDVKFSIDDPIVSDPVFHPSKHRSTIINIGFCPSVLVDGTIDYDDGKYVTMSKDGVINFWSLDLKLLRSYRDKSLTLNLRGTWVMNFVCMPDLNVIVTSSTERELRFYDTTTKKFNLILVIVLMPFAVNHMFYHFSTKKNEDNLLVCGDLGGSVRVMEFPKDDKGPFKQKVGVDMNMITWENVVKGKLPRMKAYNILDAHGDWVRQVAYYKLLGTIVSCSSSQNAMHIGDYRGIKNNYVFFLKRGG